MYKRGNIGCKMVDSFFQNSIMDVSGKSSKTSVWKMGGKNA